MLQYENFCVTVVTMSHLCHSVTSTALVVTKYSGVTLYIYVTLSHNSHKGKHYISNKFHYNKSSPNSPHLLVPETNYAKNVQVN